MARPRSLKHSASAFTLIETVLSIAVAGVVILLVFSIYHTTMQVLRGQTARREREGRARDALQTISRKITCTMPHDTSETASFTLIPAKDSDSEFQELSFVYAESVPGRRQEWFQPMRVKIACEKNGDELRLVETLQPVSGPAITNRQILAEGLELFSVQVFNGEEWLDKWPQPDPPDIPRAARFRIEFPPQSGRAAAEVDVFIPAGNVIKPAHAVSTAQNPP